MSTNIAARLPLRGYLHAGRGQTQSIREENLLESKNLNAKELGVSNFLKKMGRLQHKLLCKATRQTAKIVSKISIFQP